MSSKLVVGLPFDDPFSVPEDIVVDISKCEFSNDFSENITTAFVYLRNVEFCGDIDFSALSFEQRVGVLRLYMIRDLKDLKIQKLDYTLLNVLISMKYWNNISEYATIKSNSIFNDVELDKFIGLHSELVEELYKIFISIPLFIIKLDQSDIIKYDESSMVVSDDMPMTYECACQLLDYKESVLIGMTPIDKQAKDDKPIFFSRIFNNDNRILIDKVLHTWFAKQYDGFINQISIYAAK